MLMAPERFSLESLRTVEDSKNELVLSAASAWEIGIKHGLGRLELPGALPPHHRDPFDRLLVAQAQIEDLPILTSDPLLSPYDVTVIEGE